MNNLVNPYDPLGSNSEVLALSEKTLAIRTGVLGEKTPKYYS